MKRVIIIVTALLLVAGLFFLCRAQIRRDQPEEGETKFALCTANIYTEPDLVDSSVWASLKKGDEFTLTGKVSRSDNGKGASYTMWEGVTASGVTGWVKANAFIKTDYHGW